MTARIKIDRTRLDAFVDGELSPEEAAAVVMHLADHPADQAYVDDLFALNAALAQAFDAPLSEPMPNRIRDAITGAPAPTNVVPFARRNGAPVLAGGLALAASLVAALVLFRPAEPVSLAVGPVDAGSALAQALDTMPSGVSLAQDADRDLMILSTLPTPTGPCRELEAVDRAAARIDVALACHAPATGWRVEVMLTETLASTTGEDDFTTADGAGTEGLSPYLDQRGAGLALSPDEEAALIAQGWVE